MELIKRVNSGFEQAFKDMPKFVVKAPGRVNLIGEHTDYNDGFVLPCAIDYATLVAVSPLKNNRVEVVALDYNNERDSFALDQVIEKHETYMWANYVRGVVSELKQRGMAIVGCQLAIAGNVPQGAGLSSSAALEIGVTHAFDQLCQLNMSMPSHARLSQAAENNFVGCACGIMDQMISACGKPQKALGIDCRSLKLIDVNIPTGMTIMMINSNVKRGLVDSKYNARRSQCEAAAHHFGVTHLRDVPITLFELKKHELDPTVAIRAEHIVYENQRTLEAMQAFNQSDISRISQLMASSHASMRDLFEITTKEIDFLVAQIDQFIGDKGGVRMTGGGFGGCVVALVPHYMVDAVVHLVDVTYQAQTGLKETIYISQPAQGVSVI